MALKIGVSVYLASLVFASTVFAEEMPPIPADARMGVASTSLTIATICDLRYKRPRMVRDAKALFLKFAEGQFENPRAAADRAFAAIRGSVTHEQAQAANEHTVGKCDQLARMLKRELAR